MKILITGASRGIGKSIATELNEEGRHFMLVSYNNETLINTKAELLETNKNVNSFACDLSREDDVDKLVIHCSENDFQPNVIILSAGIFIEGSLINSSSEDLRKTMDIDLYHIYHVVKKFTPILRKQVNSKIIIIGSAASLEAFPVGALYGVAKWALKGYSVNLRKELMQDNIGVTLITPGGTLTDMRKGEDPETLLEPSDIGKLVNTILNLSPQAVVEEIIIRPIHGDHYHPK